MMVDENDDATTGDPVGHAVVAEDEGRGGVDERLTYSLSLTGLTGVSPGADQDSFTIESSTGQLLLATGQRLNFEDSTDVGTDQEFGVVVRATDPSGLSATTTVTINLVDINEAPEFSEGDEEHNYNENTTEAANTSEVDIYAATDEDADVDNRDLMWALSGDDVGQFALCEHRHGDTYV